MASKLKRKRLANDESSGGSKLLDHSQCNPFADAVASPFRLKFKPLNQHEVVIEHSIFGAQTLNFRNRLLRLRIEQLLEAITAIRVETIHDLEERLAFLDSTISLDQVDADLADLMFFITDAYDIAVVDGNEVAGLAVLVRDADFKIDSERGVRGDLQRLTIC